VTPSSTDESPPAVRERIMAATIGAVERAGVRGFSLEDVAAAAGVSRTTIYRYFPDGRQQLVEQTATWEIGRFWRRLAEAVADLPELEDRLVTGLVIGRKLMTRSRVLGSLMDADFPELIAAVQPSEPLIHGVVRDYLRDELAREIARGNVRDDVDTEYAADYLTRMILSLLGSPAGVDLTDEESARRIVRTQLLAGLVVAEP